MGRRILVCAFPKGGKTGACASLANVGYTLHHYDFDGNPDPLLTFTDAAKRKNIKITSCVDQLDLEPNLADTRVKSLLTSTQAPKGYETMLKSFVKERAEKWGPKDVVIIDTGTSMARSMQLRHMVANNRDGAAPDYFRDYRPVHNEIVRLITFFKSHLNCWLIFNTHLRLIGPDLDAPGIDDDDIRQRVIAEKLRGAEQIPWRYGPSTIGLAQVDTLALDFTGTLLIRSYEGRGRKIMTEPTDGFDAGVPVPGLPRELDIHDGMARIFKAWEKHDG